MSNLIVHNHVIAVPRIFSIRVVLTGVAELHARPSHDTVISLDEIFVACNRVDNLVDDLIRLNADWQHTLRTQLDVKYVRSLMVGDFVEILDDRRQLHAAWQVAPEGWEVLL